MNTERKPINHCPFCGNEATLIKRDASFGVMCTVCLVSVVGIDKDVAIARWNKRTPISPEPPETMTTKDMDSQEIIGDVRERFKQLERKGWEYKSFYNGWLEGRVDLWAKKMRHFNPPVAVTPDDEQERILTNFIKKISQQKDIGPEFAQIVQDNFYSLLSGYTQTQMNSTIPLQPTPVAVQPQGMTPVTDEEIEKWSNALKMYDTPDYQYACYQARIMGAQWMRSLSQETNKESRIK